MSNRFQLGSLGNDALLASLSDLVGKDRRVTADLLAHLAECDERRLYLDLGFPSLFAYCTESLMQRSQSPACGELLRQCADSGGAGRANSGWSGQWRIRDEIRRIMSDSL